jgi:thioesterase domain-containing protein/acyl carrier protein
MWSEILGVAQIGQHEDFFALGGHSLLAVRLLTRIEKVFRKTLPLAALFQAPTIAQLADLLQEDTTEKPRTFSSLVPLASDGDGPVLYCMHSVGGEAMSFRHLAGLLGPEQRVYGIQVPPEKRTTEFASSIETMASYYVQELTAFQPQGPYFLGGWSAGSTLALEMAQQLEASGRRVALVVALDGAPANTGAGTSLWNPLYYWKLLCNFPRWVVDDLMVDFSVQSAVSRVRAKLGSLGTTARAVRRRQAVPLPQVEGFMNTVDFSKDYVAFMNAVYAALQRYIPKAYAGRVLLYQAKTQPLYHLLEVDRAWGKIARHLEVVRVRGTHVSLVREPYVRPIADHLRHVLATFRAETGKP